MSDNIMGRRILTANELDAESQDFYEALADEDPLPCVLLAGAMLEKAVATLLNKFFISGDTAKTLLDERGYLGSYQSKVDVAYCLGLISKTAFKNLSKIGNIRNLFAHGHRRIDFTDVDIAKLCDEITLPKPSPRPSGQIQPLAPEPPKHLQQPARLKFTLASVTMFSVLITTPKQVTQQKRRKDEW